MSVVRLGHAGLRRSAQDSGRKKTRDGASKPVAMVSWQ
jgi:hypothetical protein